MKALWLMGPLALVLAACTLPPEGIPAYSPPEDSGLVSVRPYPMPHDVCQVIGESAATADYLDDASTLVGCPAIEQGAIQDRLSDGAVHLDHIGVWVLLSVPNR